MLPDRFLDYAGYVQRLDEVGLSAKMISPFRRPRRAFIAVPFSLPVTEEGWFVLSLDALHGLDSSDSKTVEDLVATMAGATRQLGLLLELKQPLPSGKDTRRKS